MVMRNLPGWRRHAGPGLFEVPGSRPGRASVLLAAVAGRQFSSGKVRVVERRVVSAAPGPAAAPPVTQQREFRVLMGYAVALGVFGAFAGLVFIGVIKFGGKWYTDSHPGWFGGHWWWIATPRRPVS